VCAAIFAEAGAGICAVMALKSVAPALFERFGAFRFLVKS
jgi:hypothetical protein